MRMRKIWAIGIALVLAVGIVAGFQWKDQQIAALPAVGHIPPDFTLLSTTGETVTLSQLKGKPTFINFWASWCGPCQQETPDLERMYEKYGKRIAFYGINATAFDRLGAVESFIRHYHLTYPILLDQSGSVMKSYDILGIPDSYFINRQGVVISKVVGPMSAGVMKKQFERLLQ
ncbi:MAG: TlpA family protein disulfide reductase [Sulfobacillus sp.]